MIAEKPTPRRTRKSSNGKAPAKPKSARPKKAAAGRAKASVPAHTAAEWTIEGISSHIRDRAYHLWESEGRPHGRDMELWLRAEKDVLSKILT